MAGAQPASIGRGLASVLFTAGLLFLIKFTAPFDLADNYHQERQAAYVLDVLKNDHWICQRGIKGEIASKPPLHAWIAGVASLIVGEVNRLTLTFPALAGTLLAAVIIYLMGRSWFGDKAALAGALAYLISPIGAKQIALVRIDALFPLTVTAAAWLAWRAWHGGRTRDWTWFWFVAALATLTKGPLGVILALSGLLACRWEKKTGTPLPLRGAHWAGLALFFLITVGWVLAAFLEAGYPFIEKIFFDELFAHPVRTGRGTLPLERFYQPLVYFISRFAPWSIFALLGFWRIWRRPAAQAEARRLERFLFCWFWVGLAIFSFSAHQRPDLIFPLIPAGALIAGRELILLGERLKLRFPRLIFTGLVVIGCALIYWQSHFLRRDHRSVIRTAGMKTVAEKVLASVEGDFPLTYLKAPVTLQFYLGTLHPAVSQTTAANLLAKEMPVFIVVEDDGSFLKKAPAAHPLYPLATWDGGSDGRLVILSNHPRLEWTPTMSMGFGSITFESAGLRFQGKKGLEFSFQEIEAERSLICENRDAAPQRIFLRFKRRDHTETKLSVMLQPKSRSDLSW